MKNKELKAGDYIVYHRENMDNVEHVDDMDILLDGKPHKILSILEDDELEDDEEGNSVRVEIEGVGYPYWYDKEALKKVDVPKDAKEEEMELKTSKNEDIENIEETEGENEMKEVKEPAEKLPTPEEWAELHQMYVATDRDGEVWMYATKPRKLSLSWVNDILGGFNITSLVQPQTGECWEDSLYIPTSLRTKYKAYTEPKVEWIGLSLDNKDGEHCCVSSVGCDFVNFDDGNDASFRELVEDYTLDGTPFGEKINKYCCDCRHFKPNDKGWWRCDKEIKKISEENEIACDKFE